MLHSLGASQRFKKAISAHSTEEPRWYRLAYCLTSLPLFLYVMAAYRNSSVLYFLPGLWSLLFYLMQLAVAAMLVYTLYQTGITDFIGIRQLRTKHTEPHLVKTGWYRVVRHPLYFLSLVFMILTPVMTVQWLLLIVCSLSYFIIGARIEERRLLLRFGDEYRRYLEGTPFLIPGLKPGDITRNAD